MKNKITLIQRFLNWYRQRKAARQMKVLNRMVVYSIDAAVRLAEQKCDIINHKVWVIAGSVEFVVFARYQLKSLQVNKILDKHLSGKELDEKASYIAYPVDALHGRRGKFRTFLGKTPKKPDEFKDKRLIKTGR
jgi:hypothetical protein